MASLLFLGELLIQKNQLLSFSEYLQATILFFLKLKIPTWDSTGNFQQFILPPHLRPTQVLEFGNYC